MKKLLVKRVEVTSCSAWISVPARYSLTQAKAYAMAHPEEVETERFDEEIVDVSVNVYGAQFEEE